MATVDELLKELLRKMAIHKMDTTMNRHLVDDLLRVVRHDERYRISGMVKTTIEIFDNGCPDDEGDIYKLSPGKYVVIPAFVFVDDTPIATREEILGVLESVRDKDKGGTP